MILGVVSVVGGAALFRSNKIAAISLGVMGILTFVISALAYRALDLSIAPRHAMESHAFTPGVFKEGRLYYQGHVPVLELQSDDPYAAGMAHGYLLGAPLNDMLGRLRFAMNMAKKLGQPFLSGADQVPRNRRRHSG